MIIKNPLTLPLIGAILYMLKGNEPMAIFSMCCNLQTKQIVWCARKTNDENFTKLSTPNGVSAVTIAAHYAEVHANDVK
jgi:hypothetical protein